MASKMNIWLRSPASVTKHHRSRYKDRAREGTEAGEEGEAGFLPSREPDVGLNPRTSGS
uniref:Uncharacterized protein n=1 Tax=Mustela putorius furo TaxID=9669 RepID=M3XRN7_MUSPF